MKKGWLVLTGVILAGLVVFGVMSNRQIRTHLRSEYYRLVVGDQQVTLDEYNRVTIGMDMGHVLKIVNEGRLAGPLVAGRGSVLWITVSIWAAIGGKPCSYVVPL